MNINIGYNGVLDNTVNLNDIYGIEHNGFYEVLDSSSISTFNNYPDDSHIIQKVISRNPDMLEYARITGKTFTEQEFTDFTTRFTPAYDHMSGLGQKTLVGILEIQSTDDICLQTFYRFPDSMIFHRMRENDTWGEWSWEETDFTLFHRYANDAIFLNESEIISAATNYAPRYNDTPIKNEIATYATINNYNDKVVLNSGTLHQSANKRFHNNGPVTVHGQVITKDGAYFSSGGLSLLQADLNAVFIGSVHRRLVMYGSDNYAGVVYNGNPVRTRWHFTWKYAGEGTSVQVPNWDQQTEMLIRASWSDRVEYFIVPFFNSGVSSSRPTTWIGPNPGCVVVYNSTGGVSISNGYVHVYARG